MNEEINIPLPVDENWERFEKSLLDKNSTVPPPAIVLFIKEQDGSFEKHIRLMTLQNISVIQGKSKAGKTFIISIMLPAIIEQRMHVDKFVGNWNVLKDRPGVIMEDTEQAEYDGYWTMRRIIDKCKYSKNFGYSLTREYTPQQRIDILEAALKHHNGRIGVLIIDGIADLTTAYNDEEKAAIIVQKLLTWSKLYNCHICVIIHENKSKENTEATGWLGKLLYQKAETVIAVESTADVQVKKVSSKLQRGTAQFKPFTFRIVDNEAIIEDTTCFDNEPVNKML